MLGHDVYEFFRKASQMRDSDIGIVAGLTSADGIDLRSPHKLIEYMGRSVHYDFCVNCVAYTDTSAAETTAAGAFRDYELNALAPRSVAEACRAFGTKIIHISTDYVFSDKSPDFRGGSAVFTSVDAEFPVCRYGMDKLVGELMVKDVFRSNRDFAVLRTSWLYGSHNRKSFIHKFVKNAVRRLDEGTRRVEMTSNETSVPTSVDYVIDCIRAVVNGNLRGILHAVPFSERGITRKEWADEILKWYSDEYEVGGVKLNSLDIIGVERNGYQPVYSAMKTSFDDLNDWKTYFIRFMNRYGDEIFKYAFDYKHCK